MSRIAPLAAIAALGAFGALAAPGPRRAAADEPPRVAVEVGETVERGVGFAIGLLCDDLSIIDAELRPDTPEFNVLRVTGVKPGDTRCRVGTVAGRPVLVFEIHVTARRPSPP